MEGRVAEVAVQTGLPEAEVRYYPGLYREKLSKDLQAEIENCWQTTLLPRFPDRLATNLNPHYTLASTFGVALRFWHGCSLTAWFLTISISHGCRRDGFQFLRDVVMRHRKQ